MKKPANKTLRLKTINNRTDNKIFSAFTTVKYLKEKVNESKNKDQMIELIDKWTTRNFTAKLTREDTPYGRLALSFVFNGKLKDNYKIQGKWDNDYKCWVWTMADLGKPVIFENENDGVLAYDTIFQILLYKFLKIQKLNCESMKVDIAQIKPWAECNTSALLPDTRYKETKQMADNKNRILERATKVKETLQSLQSELNTYCKNQNKVKQFTSHWLNKQFKVFFTRQDAFENRLSIKFETVENNKTYKIQGRFCYDINSWMWTIDNFPINQSTFDSEDDKNLGFNIVFFTLLGKALSNLIFKATLNGLTLD